MITHRKITQLRLQRAAQPQAPFWQAVTVAPYGAGRGLPLQINYLTLIADAKAKVEVSVTRSVRDQLERERHLDGPALIEASDVSELVYRRGEEALSYLTATDIDTICLVSSNGSLPAVDSDTRSTIVISCWPLQLGDLERMFGKCGARRFRWGVVVPLLYPVTTTEEVLSRLADLAAANGARFFATVPIETEPAARHALASMVESDEMADEDVTQLFDADTEPLIIEMERFGARAARDRGMLDHVPSLAPLSSNWTAAMKLSLAGTRLIRMHEDMELGWNLHRSSQLIAKLHKPIERIAASASLAIIDSLDLASVAALEQWLREGRSDFFEDVDERWRGEGL